MKLRDLARSSNNPTSFMPAFHILRHRLWNREISSNSHKSYESVPRSITASHLLTLQQQATMVPVLGILRHPRHPGSPVTIPIRAHRYNRNFRKRACRRLVSFLYPLIFD